jgi:hypothetical protein
MASLMSTNNTIDVAIMKDFDEEEEDEGKKLQSILNESS